MKKLNEILTARNLMFATVAVMVLLAAMIAMGLLTPFIIRLTTGQEILLDAAYFNVRAALPTFALVLLFPLCLLLEPSGRKEGLAVASAGFFGAVLCAYLSPFSNTVLDISFPPLAAAFFASVSKILSVLDRKSLLWSVRKASAHLVHLGIVLVLIGIVFSTSMKMEDSAVIQAGGSAAFGQMGYTVQVTNISSVFEGEPYGEYSGSEYINRIDFDVYKAGKFLEHGQTEYVSDLKWGQPYTVTYIHRGLLEEFFVAPKSVDPQNQAVDLYVRKVPFMNFLWGGFFIMVLGITLLFISDSRLNPRSCSRKKRVSNTKSP